MRRFRFKKYVLPLLVLTALAAVGAASTNALGIGTGAGVAGTPDVGYAAVTLNSPYTVSDIQYATDSEGNLASVNLTFGSAVATDDSVYVTLDGNGDTNDTGADAPAVLTCSSETTTTYDCANGGSDTVDDLNDVEVSVLPSSSPEPTTP